MTTESQESSLKLLSLGKVLGGLGLVLLLSSPFTLFGGPTTTVRELIERVMIDDTETHIRGIQAAIAARSPT